MRVVCDNCGASYKIPDSKLTKEVNKATCRKCGHAIFIRRAGEEEPKPAAPPPAPVGEERTLITSAADLERAVRARASGYDETADQRPTTVSLDQSSGENTVPREPAAPAFPPPVAQGFPPASPFAPPPGAAPSSTVGFLQAAGYTPPPVTAPVAPPPVAPPPVAVAPPPAPAPAPQAAAPRPAPAISPADSRPAEPVRPAPPPPFVPTPAAAPAAHDPRTDLGIALAALFVTVLGVLVLAVANLVGIGVVAGLGVFLSLLGVFVAVLILVSGGRGTRPASLVVSLLGGLFLSGVASGSITAAFIAFPRETELPPVATITPPVAPPVATPATPPAADLAAVAVAEPPAAPVEPPPTEPVAPPVATTPPPAAPPAATTPPPATPPPATTAPATTSSRSTSSTSSRSTSSSSTSSDTPVRIPASSSSSSTSASSTKSSSPSSTKSTTSSTPSSSSSSTSSAAKSTGVSPVVIDTMIKSNKGVKTCFVNQRNETGDLPRGVKVKLTIQPSGKVSSAGIPSGEWQGTDFDSCLSGAVKSITFPPFDGDAVTVTYPFSI